MENPAVVFLHFLGGSAREWQPVMTDAVGRSHDVPNVQMALSLRTSDAFLRST